MSLTSFSPALWKIQGRGANCNPPNRFESVHYHPEKAGIHVGQAQTELYEDNSRSIITSNDSPDVGFDFSINPYRGCEHGCIYCYARPTHEYLGFSCGLDFETKILIKKEAAKLLRKRLSSRHWQPQVVALGSITDPYQPMERKFRLTRSVVEVLTEFLNPVSVVTKNYLVTRDIDLLRELTAFQAVTVGISITTLDPGLQRQLEPRTSSPLRRLAAIEELSRAGIPTRVLIAPVLPGLTDHEIPSIVQASSRAGARFASYMFLRLPHAVRGLFEGWLHTHFPGRKERVLNRIRELHGGKLNDHRFHYRIKGEGEYARQVDSLFMSACRKFNLKSQPPELSAEAFRRPHDYQMTLFD